MELLPERALLWPERGILFCADLHLGKSAAFRAHGLAVPEGSDGADLARLRALAQTYAIKEIILLGDFQHAPAGSTPALREAVRAWRASLGEVRVVIVAGNHDRGLASWADEAGLELHQPPCEREPFHLRHEPPAGLNAGEAGPALTFCGHLHPAVRLREGGHTLRPPCFWLSRQLLVLPAFGSFTGSANIQPGPRDRIFAIIEGAVCEIPVPALTAKKKRARN